MFGVLQMHIILIILELCLFIPLAKIREKENRCTAYTCGYISDIHCQKTREIFFTKECYIPTIIYEVNGNIYKFQHSKSSNADEYQVLDDFWVMYDPNNPSDVFQEDEFALMKARFMAITAIWLIVITLALTL